MKTYAERLALQKQLDLEHSADEVDEFLAHYGVRGMKWGTRRGGLKERAKGAALDRNQQKTAIVKRALNRSKNGGNDEKIARAVGISMSLGRKRFEKRLNKQMNKLANEKARIESGNATVRDKLKAVGNLNITDLVVSRQDNKGD